MRTLLGLIVFTAWLCGGCASAKHFDASGDFAQHSFGLEYPATLSTGVANSYGRFESPIGASLIPEDQKAIGNDAVDVLLTGKLKLPEHAKLAVVCLGGGAYLNWGSPDTHKLSERNDARLVEQLKTSKRVNDVLLVPPLLIERATVSSLRAVAARCQADLLLIYAGRHQSYTRSRFLQGDRATAYCRVEAVLIDVRSGVAALTTAATDDFKVEQSKEGYTFAETLSNAQAESLGRALGEVAGKVVKYLDEGK